MAAESRRGAVRQCHCRVFLLCLNACVWRNGKLRNRLYYEPQLPSALCRLPRKILRCCQPLIVVLLSAPYFATAKRRQNRRRRGSVPPMEERNEGRKPPASHH